MASTVAIILTDENKNIEVKSVVEVPDEQSATEALKGEALGCFEGAKLVTNKDELLGGSIGDYGIVCENDKIRVWMLRERVKSGWVYSTAEKRAVCVATLTYKKVGKADLPLTLAEKTQELEAKLQELQSKIKQAANMQLKAESDKFLAEAKHEILEKEYETLAAQKSSLSASLADCRKANVFVIGERDKYLQLVEDKILEIYTLSEKLDSTRKMLKEREEEVVDLREKLYARESGTQTRTKVASVNYSPVYSEAIDLIKNFDMSSLKSRRERDEILEKKYSEKHEKPGKIPADKKRKYTPPPWLNLRSN